jgi:uncharacterized cupin superfamily protein
MTDEAHLEQTPGGLRPTDQGWFVVNVRDTEWQVSDAFGAGCVFEARGPAAFPDLGINVNVLEPGQPLCFYHEEGVQEDFLVLSGECRLIVDEQERPLRAWDFVHCPAFTEHVLIGSGDGLSVVLAVGARREPEHIRYPRSELAAQYDASAEVETLSPKEAYARITRPRVERPAYWDQLPWA